MWGSGEYPQSQLYVLPKIPKELGNISALTYFDLQSAQQDATSEIGFMHSILQTTKYFKFLFNGGIDCVFES